MIILQDLELHYNMELFSSCKPWILKFISQTFDIFFSNEEKGTTLKKKFQILLNKNIFQILNMKVSY